jgi:SAM-dependent methyltransferase
MPRTSRQSFKMELRPELELIVCCARTRSGAANQGRVREILRGGVDWQEVAATAIQHKLVPIVFDGLTSAGGDQFPPGQRELLRALAQDSGTAALTLFREMLRLHEMFEAENIPVIPYKGPLLSWLAYGNLTRRMFADLDLVVPQVNIPCVISLMQAAGYNPEFDLRESHTGQEGHAPGQYSFFQRVQSFRVELHTERTLRYFPVPLDFTEMARRQITVELAGRKLHTFSVEDTLVMLCVHGAKHFWERLSWIVDIAELIHAQPVDWPLTLRIAEKLKSRRLLLLGLYLAHGMLGASLPVEILKQAEQDSNVGRLTRTVCNQFAGRADPSTGVLPRAAFRILSRDRIRDGVWHMLRLATSPTETDRQSIHLPRVLAFFYAMVRPWRLMREYGIGLQRRTKPDLAIFEPTPAEIVDHMLRLADVGPGDVLYDLGCGEGAIVVAAAEKYGIRAVGADINPKRIAKAQANARRHGVKDRVELRRQDAKRMDFTEATVVTLFLGADGNLRLANRLRAQLRPGARIVSRDFQIYGWTPERVEKHELSNGILTCLYLWRIPERTTQDSLAESSGLEAKRSIGKGS